MKDLPESDWKKFNGLLEIAMQRYFERATEEMKRRVTAEHAPAKDRFWDAFEYAQKQRRRARELFDEYRRSTALIQLALMRRDELLTDEELMPLTQATRQFIQGLLDFPQH
jgi:hypothetical protein